MLCATHPSSPPNAPLKPTSAPQPNQHSSTQPPLLNPAPPASTSQSNQHTSQLLLNSISQSNILLALRWTPKPKQPTLTVHSTFF